MSFTQNNGSETLFGLQPCRIFEPLFIIAYAQNSTCENVSMLIIGSVYDKFIKKYIAKIQ